MLTSQEITTLSKLPPREVLIAQVIGAIAAPLTQLVGVIEALYADPIRVIGAVADKAAEGSPIPVAEAKPEPVAASAPANDEPAAEATAEATAPVAEAAAEVTETASEPETAEAPAPEAEATEGEAPQE